MGQLLRYRLTAVALLAVQIAGITDGQINDWVLADRQLPPDQELLSWDEAYAQAEALLQKMTPEEKFSLVNGIGYTGKAKRPDKWWYMGDTKPIPRLDIPSLNMQDSSAGFRLEWREMLNTATCWPSLLALAATWDPSLVHLVAQGIGDEFAGKGANVILGPSVNVHRVARGGRNFEYLSGEDPYLGSRLAEAYVKGVQSRGLMAVVKHWVFNEQETNRQYESSIVDQATAWQLYYPPFIAAVRAGVAGVMCSYNRIGSWKSCSNPRTMQDLKTLIGFRGFVQSDWWAADEASFPHGMDQDMPGNDGWLTSDVLAEDDEDAYSAARRVLASMKRFGLSAKCSPPDCKDYLLANVTSDAHARLALIAASESIVLLKNEAEVLPVVRGTIAVIGSAAVAKPFDITEGGMWNTGDYYSGGGSGHINENHVVTPLECIQRRARQANVEVRSSTSDDLEEAAYLASQVDVAIVVVATTSGEQVDRPHLHLDNQADQLIEAVAARSRRTIVLCQVPGAVVMPWRHQVEGIALMFLAGQETGSAWARILFGDLSPEGRLPIMIPETEADTVQPSQDSFVVYSEGLETSYRSRIFRAAFPFGHGLSYTTFAYSEVEAVKCGKEVCFSLVVTNTGSVPGKAVPQLYLEFPERLGLPRKLLKGFQKTRLLSPHDAALVRFRLRSVDCMYFSERSGWVMQNQFRAHVADSAEDFRSSVEVDLDSPHQKFPIAFS
eukprot:TRINITY_DN32727_c0_g1_i1.p1 TRINITY_DN32727_c0_g1~~TRINITY_DN32727_c0_g1_i1.p1  ORF type:complete len:723 (+),score=145.21 TRINITY_DN32727_c0_g1_i1:127-2295(+)